MGIRVGICTASHHYVKTNNKYMKDYEVSDVVIVVM